MVTDTTLNTDVWTDIKNVLVAASIVATVTETSTTYAANISAAFNDKRLSRPQVVVYPIRYDETKNKFSDNYGKQMVNVTVECWSDMPKLMDQVANQVSSALSATTIGDMELTGISVDTAFNSPGQNKVFLKTLTFHYLRE